MASYIKGVFILIFGTCTLGERLGCPPICRCPENPTCPLGTSMVLDSCECGCKVCVQDLDAQCDGLRPCDPTKNLTCVYQGDLNSQEGVCKEPGLGVDRSRFQDWMINQPSDNYPTPEDEDEASGVKIRTSREAPDSDTEEILVPVKDSSLCQPATEWTPCSRTCGFGNSVRITYEQENCTPKAERRLCMIRPCKGQYATANYTVLKSTNVCSRIIRWSQPLHLRFRDCLSNRSLLPKFCGHCSDGRFCTPSLSRTRPVSFQCANRGRKVIHQVMWVQRCHCGGKGGKKGSGRKTGAETAMQSEDLTTNEVVEEV